MAFMGANVGVGPNEIPDFGPQRQCINVYVYMCIYTHVSYLYISIRYICTHSTKCREREREKASTLHCPESIPSTYPSINPTIQQLVHPSVRASIHLSIHPANDLAATHFRTTPHMRTTQRLKVTYPSFVCRATQRALLFAIVHTRAPC